MDPLRVRASVKPFGATSGYEAEFAVDAIATNLIAPASALADAGIQASGRMKFEYPDQSAKELPFAFAEVEVLGEPAVGRVIFGPEDTEPMIGSLLFESAGFVIDPDTQKIKRRIRRL